MLQNIVSDCTVRIFCTVLYIHILNAKSIGSEHSTPSSRSHLLKSFFLGFNNEVQMESPKVRAQSEVFQGREGFGELGHFDKYFVKNLRKKAPQRKILEFFLQNLDKDTRYHLCGKSWLWCNCYWFNGNITIYWLQQVGKIFKCSW